MIDQQPTTIDPQPMTTAVVSLTDAAVSKLTELTKEETNPAIGLRVYVYSGGCSGFRYGMMLEDAPTPEDNVLHANGVRVYVDGQSIPRLDDAMRVETEAALSAGQWHHVFVTYDGSRAARGIKVYVDGSSISLLQGSQIDYVDTLMGAGFTVNNPNAVAACGCGSSFRTADDGGAPGGCSH